MVYLDADTSLRGHKFRRWRCYLFLTQITLANLQTATNNCLELIKAVLESDSEFVCENCHCRKSLDLAVWMDQNQISPADKEKIKILFE